MSKPAVSVIMPVYNAEAFLKYAIDSILGQSFADLEFIIINDGSSDTSKKIIQSYSDKRIVYLENEKNSGLIYSLNKAIELAEGQYIARMDADDIATPDRLEKQKDFLDQHNDIAAVATTISFIDEEGKETGLWELDQKTIEPSQIKNSLPNENCIAHPTMMIRSGLLKKLKYKPKQKNIEDYDLWLRMVNRGYPIAKLKDSCLLYRVHTSSITGKYLKKRNFFFKHFRMKLKFAIGELVAGELSWFWVRVIIAMFIDLVKGIGKSIKNIFKR